MASEPGIVVTLDGGLHDPAVPLLFADASTTALEPRPICELALRATTESALSTPPSRAATRNPISRLPGVAARVPHSNSVK